MMATNSWHVKRLSAALGAEVSGVTLAQADDGDIAEVKRLLNEHMVLFFPDQHMAADDHIAFGHHFGPLEGHPNLKERTPEDHPELFRLAASEGGIADEWHTDLTFLDRPALLSILNMKQCPEIGGDTMWSNLFAAYEGLSPPLREMCDGLSAVHDALPHDRADRMTVHPLVRIDPDSGRKALYVNEHFTRRIVEMNAPESENLLAYLTNWVKQPAFTVRYHWHAGSIGMWDNRFTQHYVVNDFVGERVIERVTVMGDRPVGAAPRWRPWPEGAGRSAMSRHDRQLDRYLKAGTAEAAE
ncbi:MAG: TauD/TfdA family dioxygenase [Alphaproteobacteria bacterium]|jgi:taurine dioxygenase|nr:TauD/TfdA family dioxygenase [Alphaproteobacteria bacterium]MDP6814392.1 TauD/TfdA family dioxygenase [Alphaproteobacteria bacterium]